MVGTHTIWLKLVVKRCTACWRDALSIANIFLIICREMSIQHEVIVQLPYRPKDNIIITIIAYACMERNTGDPVLSSCDKQEACSET